MARIRTIKPEFFTSSDIVELSPLARLFYIGLWCEADRLGRLEWKARTLKLRYLPGDQCSVDELAKELTNSGMVVLYEVEGKQYAEIMSFQKHQVINNRESESSIPARVAHASSTRQPRVKAEGRKEGKEGKEGTPPSPQRGDEDVFEDFWLAWPKNERKQDKAKCLDHWKRHELTATAEAILADVRVKRGTQKWQDGFIEAPLVYLRGKRWEDGVTPESDGGNELGAQAWHETRKGIEAKGVELEIGLWDQNAFEIGRGEPWPTYQARVFRAAGHQPLRAIA